MKIHIYTLCVYIYRTFIKLQKLNNITVVLKTQDN